MESERTGHGEDVVLPVIPGRHRSPMDSPVRRTIVDLLSALPSPVGGESPGLTAAELAERLDLHVTTVRFHLDQLAHGGILETEFRSGRVGRPRKFYRLRPGGLLADSSVEAFAALTEVLADAWPRPGEPAISPVEAGRRWMLRQAQPPEAPARAGAHPDEPTGTTAGWFGRLGRVIDLLERWGYRPDLRTSEGGEVVEMTLVDCPFIPLAATRADVVCGAHQGLLEGALESTGETEVEVRLLPLITPRSCAAHLRRRPAPAAEDPLHESSHAQPKEPS